MNNRINMPRMRIEFELVSRTFRGCPRILKHQQLISEKNNLQTSFTDVENMLAISKDGNEILKAYNECKTIQRSIRTKLIKALDDYIKEGSSGLPKSYLEQVTNSITKLENDLKQLIKIAMNDYSAFRTMGEEHVNKYIQLYEEISSAINPISIPAPIQSKPLLHSMIPRMRMEMTLVSRIFKDCPAVINNQRLITEKENVLRYYSHFEEKLALSEDINVIFEAYNQSKKLQRPIRTKLIIALDDYIKQASVCLSNKFFEQVTNSITRLENLLTELIAVPADNNPLFQKKGEEFVIEYICLFDEIDAVIKHVSIQRPILLTPSLDDMITRLKNYNESTDPDPPSQNPLDPESVESTDGLANISETVKTKSQENLTKQIANWTLLLSQTEMSSHSRILKSLSNKLTFSAWPNHKTEADENSFKHYLNKLSEGLADLDSVGTPSIAQAYFASLHYQPNRIPVTWKRYQLEYLSTLDNKTYEKLLQFAGELLSWGVFHKKVIGKDSEGKDITISIEEKNWHQAAELLLQLPIKIRDNLGSFDSIIKLNRLKTAMCESQSFRYARLYGVRLPKNKDKSDTSDESAPSTSSSGSKTPSSSPSLPCTSIKEKEESTERSGPSLN